MKRFYSTFEGGKLGRRLFHYFGGSLQFFGQLFDLLIALLHLFLELLHLWTGHDLQVTPRRKKLYGSGDAQNETHQ